MLATLRCCCRRPRTGADRGAAAAPPPGHRAIGVDVDWQAIDWCGANLPGRYHLIQPAGRLPFDDRTFCAAYAFNVFTHLGEHEQVDRLSEIHRVLNPGRALIVTRRGKAAS
jgi:SAM-dependent methyltransferase